MFWTYEGPCADRHEKPNVKLSAKNWLERVGKGVRERVPDATVVLVHDHCLSVASIKVVFAITAAYGSATVNSALADDEGLWSHDGVKLEMRSFPVDASSIDEAVDRVVSLIS